MFGVLEIYYTVGIVVGAWLCGTITMIGELFGAESKTQIYGSLHTFLQENKEGTKVMGNHIHAILLAIALLFCFLIKCNTCNGGKSKLLLFCGKKRLYPHPQRIFVLMVIQNSFYFGP